MSCFLPFTSVSIFVFQVLQYLFEQSSANIPNTVTPSSSHYLCSWQEVHAISTPSTAQHPMASAGCLGQPAALPTAWTQQHSHHLPWCHRRQEKVQDKLQAFKWKMFLRQLIGQSLHSHICYLGDVHLFALCQLFIATLYPLLIEGNLNQTSLKTICFTCLCCRALLQNDHRTNRTWTLCGSLEI